MTLVEVWIAWSAAQEPSVEDLVDRLRASEIETRTRAADELVRRGAAEAVRPLRRSDDPDLAWRARVIVGRVEWRDYLPERADGLPDEAFARLGSDDLDQYRRGVEAVAAGFSSTLGFARKTRDEPDDARARILFRFAPCHTTEERKRRWIENLDESDREFGDLLSSWARIEDAGFWRPLLRSPVRPRRWMAARTLADQGDEEGLAALEEFITDTREEIAERAISTLAGWGRARARPKIVAELTREGGRRRAALQALRMLGWEGTGEILRGLAHGAPEDWALPLHEGLIALGDRTGLPHLLSQIPNESGFKLGLGGYCEVALLYDCEEAVEAVVNHLEKNLHGD